MIVVLDANALIANSYAFSSANADALLRYVEMTRSVQLCVPEVAVLEAVNHHREHLENAIAKLKSDLTSLQGLHAAFRSTPQADVDIEESVTRYERELRDRLHSARILPIPEVPHGRVLHRALARRRPFDEKGHDGYRDCLIWESLLAHCALAEQEVCFVTGDRAFVDRDASTLGLHAHLLEDLAHHSIDSGSFYLFPDVAAFVKARVLPNLTRLDQLSLQLLDNTFPDLRLPEVLQDHIDQIMTALAHELPTSRSTPPVSRCEAIALNRFGDVESVDVFEWSPDVVFVFFSLSAYCSVLQVSLPSPSEWPEAVVPVEVPFYCVFELNTETRAVGGFVPHALPRRGNADP